MLLRAFPILLAASAFAQAPALIDNDQTHVVVAHDAPHKKSAPHQHQFNRVMIYMTAGRQEIISADGKKTTLVFKAGDVKWSPASGMHTSEVVSDAPVEIVEVEVKKPGDPSKKITTPLDPVKVDPKGYKVEFENDQVRVSRVKFAPNGGAPMHEHQLNRVVVYLTDQNSRMTTPDGASTMSVHKAGEASWGGPGKHKEDNVQNKPFEAIVIDFKS